VKLQEMLELIRQHHPHIGDTEACKVLNRVKNDFCARSEIVRDSFSSLVSQGDGTVIDQRYYTLDSRIIKVQDVWLNDVKIPRLVGKPIIDDDTGENG